ncbi:hypothetical protein J7M00_05100 [bacterium]|nr:hypothetical protein [bacterium]
MSRIGVIVIGLLGCAFLYAQSPPVLDALDDYTAGTTCQLHWELSSGEPVAYHIQVIRTDTGDVALPDSVDSLYSIFPIPPEDAPDNSYTIGLDLIPGSIADDPLTDGATYCYRIQYIYEVSEDVYDYSEWSDTVCSVQDNSAPVIDSVFLSVWQNSADTDIPFFAMDEVMGATAGAVQSIILYYRTDSTSDWTSFDEFDYSSFTPPISHYVTFNSADVGGDGYYQFYIAGRDALGNETDPNEGLTPHPMHCWTRFDTELPTSSVDDDALEDYYTTSTITIPFTASDTYSGVMYVLLKYRLADGPLTTLDSSFYGGAATVDDEMTDYFPADGCYDIFFVAVDSAGNEEVLGEAEESFCIDTRRPDFSSPSAFDTTTASHRYDVAAEGGYSNENAVFVLPEDAEDIPPGSDTYASGIESVYVAEDEVFTENLAAYPYSEGENYLYELTDGDGVRNIYVMLKDVAGNYSDTISQTIVLDTDAPLLAGVNIYDRTSWESDETDEQIVQVEILPDAMSSSFYKVFLTQNETDLEDIPEDGWQDISGTDTLLFTFSGFFYGDTMRIYAVVKDSAGNVSNDVTNYIVYSPPNNYTVSILSKRDIDGPDTTGTYTDTTHILIDVSFGRDVDSIMVKDDGSSSWTAYPAPEIAGTESDTVIEYVLTPGDGIRTIYVRGESETYEFPTDEVTTEIILDTRDPDAGTIDVLDISTGFDATAIAEIADPGYTNDPNVKIVFTDAHDPSGASSISTGIYHLHAVCSSEENEAPYCVPTVLDFTLPDEDGSWTVYGSVQDSAGNWSSEISDDIVLDTYRPRIISVVIRDSSSLSPLYTDSPKVLVGTTAGDSSMGLPAYIAFFEDPGLWPENLSELWQEYHHELFYTFSDSSPGIKVLYVAVKDRAGNISFSVADSIRLGVSAITQFVPFDYDRGRTFNQYTNSPTIGVFFDYSGIPPAQAIVVEDTLIEEPSIDDPNWVDFPEDSNVQYTFEEATEGEKVIKGWLKSLAGTIFGGNIGTIVLDMTPPELADGFSIWDTTSADVWPSIFKAHMGWSNELYVYGSVPSAVDTLSNVDSLHFIGPFEDELWTGDDFSHRGDTIQVPYPADSVGLVLDGTFGSFDIIGGAMDGAGNRRNITVHAGYDTIAPTLTPIAFYNPDTSMLPSTIPLHIEDEPDGGHLWKVCYKFEEIETLDFVCVDYRMEWGTYPDFNNVDFPAESLGLDPQVQYTIYAVAVDSAGNPSEPVKLNLWSKIDFKVVDINDTLDSDYTGSQTVLAVINCDPENPPDSMKFAEVQSALASTPWQPFSRTSEFTFETSVNETKRVYAQVMFGSSVTSEFNYDEIILDTVPPTVVRIDAEDPNTGDPNWSQQRTVKITITGASDTPPGVVNALMVSESPDFDYNTQILEFTTDDPVVMYEAAEEAYEPPSDASEDLLDVLHNGQRRLFARVLDRAENESQTKTYDIFIDWEALEVVNFPNPFNPNEGPTHIRLKGLDSGANVDVKIYDMFGNPVWSGVLEVESGSHAGQIEWDGKNDDGEIVGNGGYICIIDMDGNVVKRKIAVWKGSE